MIPITPKGTLTFVSFIPLGRMLSFRTLPSGEGSVATFRMSEEIPFNRSSVSFSRSYFGLSGDIRSRSFRFSERIYGVCAKAASATAFNIRFICSSGNNAKRRLAACTAANVSFRFIRNSFIRCTDSHNGPLLFFHAFRWRPVLVSSHSWLCPHLWERPGYR